MTLSASAVSGFLQHRSGERIKDRYEVLEHLGGGNFGSVYRVLDSVVGNFLACKEMHVLDDPNTAQDERGAALDLFKREALNLATLRHPHIPAAYFEQEDGLWRICPRCGFDFAHDPRALHDTANAASNGAGPDAGYFCPDHNAALLTVTQRYYLMMDFIDGPTLEEMAQAHLREQGRPLDASQCLEWILEVGSALRSLHRVGIIHRDVKPDNIKIRSVDSVAMLLDFGLTKKVEEAGGYGTVRISGTSRFGTSGYAPDDPAELERPGRQSDVHALGMTLYRLVSGRDPQEPDQLAEMRAQSPRFFNGAIAPEVERVIRRAIEPEVARRYDSIDEMLADLQEIQAPQAKAFRAPPFTFADGSRARTAGELARMMELYPDEARNYLFNGMFLTWLRQNGLAAPAGVAERVVHDYAQKPQHALEMLRRALYPAGTTNILPHLAAEPKTLDFGTLDSGERRALSLHLRNKGPGLAWGKVVLADEDATPLPGLSCHSTFEGNDVTLQVHLDTGKVAAGGYAGDVIIQTDDQTLSVPVSYTVNPLQLVLEPPELDFGTVLVGKRVGLELQLRTQSETSKGKPRGTIYNSASLGGLVAPERFEGEEPISIFVDGGMPDAVAKMYEGALQLDTNGGRLRVPVRYRIALPPGRLVSLLLSAIVAGGAGGALLRLGYWAINASYALRWLEVDGAVVPLQIDNLQAPVALGAVAGLGFGIYWTARTWNRRNVNQSLNQNTRQNTSMPQMLAQTLALCAVLGAALCWPLIWLLHWCLWGFGDWLLLPTARVLGNFGGGLANLSPPVMWGGAGALGGSLWGIARAFTAIGKPWVRYSVGVFLMFVFLVVLVNAMLSTGY